MLHLNNLVVASFCGIRQVALVVETRMEFNSLNSNSSRTLAVCQVVVRIWVRVGFLYGDMDMASGVSVLLLPWPGGSHAIPRGHPAADFLNAGMFTPIPAIHL